MDPEKKKSELIKKFMEHSGMSKQEAEFAAAIEIGEIAGDVILVENEENNKDEF